MKAKRVYFCLILIMASLWTEPRTTDALFKVSVPSPPLVGDEFYPVSIRERAETRAAVEAVAFGRQGSLPLSVVLVGPNQIGSALEERPTSYAFGAAHACYMLMSLQP